MKTLILILSAASIAFSQYNYHPHAFYPQHIPIIDHNGVPVDTPEVQAARANHLAALSAASHGSHSGHQTVPWVHSGSHGGVYGHQAVPEIAPDGRPLDTPEVHHAKIAHFAAYNEAAARNSIPHHRYRRSILYTYPYTQYPVIGHDGSPIETPEVQAAKAHHFAAHAEAHHRNAIAPLDYTYKRYAEHIPLITANGVPLDTPEVQHAKAEHFAAHAEAASRAHYGGHYVTIVPVDTAEVQLAKIQHFAAHAAAHAHHY